MKTKTKILKYLLAFILGVLFIFQGTIIIFPHEVEFNKTNALVRSVPISYTSYEEQVNILINSFSDYSSYNNSCGIQFEGSLPINLLNEDSIADSNKNYEKKIKTNYDFTTNLFWVEISVYEETVMIDSWQETVEPLYDKEKDEGYIEIDNERFYLSECFKSDTLDNCFVPAIAIGAVGVVAASALAVTILVASPTIRQEICQTVTTVVETVVQSVRTFFGWFCRWIKQTFTRTHTVTTPSVVTKYTPTLIINGINIETEEVTINDLYREDKYPKGNYYLCFVSKKIYVSVLPIKDYEAKEILKSGTIVTDENSGSQMLASTYTRCKDDAYRIAVAAGLNSRTPYSKPEFEHGAYHYHSSIEKEINGEIHSPHSFFLY